MSKNKKHKIINFVTEDKEEAKHLQKGSGMTTAGVRNTVKDGKFVIVCGVCQKIVKSMTNNMCEECYNDWFTREGKTKKQYVGKSS